MSRNWSPSLWGPRAAYHQVHMERADELEAAPQPAEIGLILHDPPAAVAAAAQSKRGAIAAGSRRARGRPKVGPP
jgi:hypothetical protein